MTKLVDLSKMFPKQVVLLSTEELKEKQLLFKFAHAYLKATDADKKKLIWISTEQPADKLPFIFKEYGYPINEYVGRILFLDIVSMGAGVDLPKTNLDVEYIENPNNIVEISMTMSDLFNDPSVGLAVIDSVNGLLAFNGKERVTQLLRFLSPIARRTNTSILTAYERGEFSSDVEMAVRLTADVTMAVEGKTLFLITRKGSRRLEVG
jgi:archaellum biogenesis ATPase FlaH